MRKLVISIALLGGAGVFGSSAAEARSYQYCLKNSPGPGDCKYSTYRQCMASASGTRAICVRNYGPRR